MKVELSLYARNLVNVSGPLKGKSDPFAVVTHMATERGKKPVVLGKTETLPNTFDPQWAKVFTFDYELGTPMKLAISVFDECPKENKDMGCGVFEVGELMGASGCVQGKKLRRGGTLFAQVRQSEGQGILRLRLRGVKLKSVEGFGLIPRSDPFFELARPTAGKQSWDNVYRSDVVRNNMNPQWKDGSVELSSLCGNDLNADVQINVYDYESSGRHKFMGSVISSVNKLVEACEKNIEIPLMKDGKEVGKLLVDRADLEGVLSEQAEAVPASMPQVGGTGGKPSSSNQGGGSSILSTMVPTSGGSGISQGGNTSNPILSTMVPTDGGGSYGSSTAASTSGGGGGGSQSQGSSSHTGSSTTTSAPSQPGKKPTGTHPPTFVDYIRGGCSLEVVVAIDFTGSNGNPREKGTLHYIDTTGATKNDYQNAISSIMTILKSYASKKQYPVYGFGAKINGNEVSHCFQCGDKAEVQGTQGVLDAYRQVFRTGLTMSSPTTFVEVMKKAASRARSNQEKAKSNGRQAYTVLLIVSDGAIADKEETAKVLTEISDAPLSIVIVGVGTEDFTAMEFLDEVNAKNSRDIVNFVEYNFFKGNNRELTRATLREIPDQLVSYFRQNKIAPLPPVEASGDNIQIDDQGEEPDLKLNIGSGGISVAGGGEALEE
jgi:hypothetical protein